MSNNEKPIGALWENDGQKGPYMSGKLELPSGEVIEVIVFRNRFKKPGERSPDWRMFQRRPRNEQSHDTSGQAPKRYQSDNPEPVADDDIPF